MGRAPPSGSGVCKPVASVASSLFTGRKATLCPRAVIRRSKTDREGEGYEVRDRDPSVIQSATGGGGANMTGRSSGRAGCLRRRCHCRRHPLGGCAPVLLAPTSERSPSVGKFKRAPPVKGRLHPQIGLLGWKRMPHPAPRLAPDMAHHPTARTSDAGGEA